MSGLNRGYFETIVRRDHPLWPASAIRYQAQRMLERHPFIEKAHAAGLEQGRDLRQRMEAGLGVWWPEMEPLTPEERGFVLALVRSAIQPKKLQIVTDDLADVRKRQEQAAYDARNDALAEDWREKSDRPDKLVRGEKPMPENA